MTSKRQPIFIRKALLDDFPNVYGMMCELEEKRFNKKKLRQVYYANVIHPDVVYLIAEQNGQVIGFLSLFFQRLLHHSGLVGEIQELFVDKSLRGQGIGAQMVAYARRLAKSKGCVLIEVASNRVRIRTHRFYEKQGFKKSHYKFTYEL